MRRGEIPALQWDDLDARTGALRVERQVQKIKGERAVFLPKTRTSSRSVIPAGPHSEGSGARPERRHLPMNVPSAKKQKVAAFQTKQKTALWEKCSQRAVLSTVIIIILLCVI